MELVSLRWLPDFALTWQNGFLPMVPLFILRFGAPAVIDRNAMPRLDFFPPTIGIERAALTIYFITNTTLIFSPLAMRLGISGPGWTAGLVLYLSGCAFFALSVIAFCRRAGLTRSGIYRLSRNPMYIGYYLIFLGTGFMLGSWVYLLLVQVYQLAVHFLVLSEERWCLETYGAAYRHYLDEVPRYLLIRKSLS